MLDVSVIVCTKNSEQTIVECLESVNGNGPLEIIVVDGNSSDNTTEIARRYTEKIYSDGGRGLASARQLGAEKATSDYVSYVDSDVILPEDCLAKMLQEIQQREYVGIHAQIVSPENRSYWEWAEDQHFKIAFNKEGERKSMGTIAAIYERDKVLTYKFDPFFSGASEDADL